jgi:hypothetical protein
MSERLTPGWLCLTDDVIASVHDEPGNPQGAVSGSRALGASDLPGAGAVAPPPCD